MATVTAGDMVDRAQDFEARLEALYADIRDRCTSDGVGLVTHYLARHRRHLPEALEAYSAAQIARIRKVQLKYDDSVFSPDKLFEREPLPDDVQASELLDVAIEFVEPLIGFYRWLTERPLGDDAIGLFTSLLRVEERAVIELKKMKAMNYF